MYNTLNVLLMFTALAVPYVCLCKHIRQKPWPVIAVLICGSGFLLLQIVLLALRVRWAGEYGLPQLTASILRLSLLFLIGLTVSLGCYICSAFYREEGKGKLLLGAGGQFFLFLVLQLVLQLPPVLYGIFGADASQYTGFNLTEKALPWMWIMTFVVMGTLVARNRSKLSWVILLPVILVPLSMQLLHPMLTAGRTMEQMAYELDDYYRVLFLTYTAPVLLLLAITMQIKRGKGKYLLGLSLAGLICAMALTAPNVYYVNSKETVYAYELGETAPRGSYQISVRGVFVEHILERDYFDGWWSVEGFTDGEAHITTFSPDDRPYKQVTRYDEKGEKIEGASFQFFGNSRFTEYLITVDRMMEDSNPTTDWDLEKGNILCTDAPDWQSMVEIAGRHNINLSSSYEEQVEVVP